MKFVVLGDCQEMYQKGRVCMYRVVVLFIKAFFSIIFYFRQHSGCVQQVPSYYWTEISQKITDVLIPLGCDK